MENNAQKELVQNIKVEWKRLWSERIDDHVRAEGIADHDYSLLTVERGTIIHATRDFKALSLKEALEQNKVENLPRYLPPDPQEGGWKKFVKSHLARVPTEKSNSDLSLPSVKVQRQQLKNGGRGWLHK